MSSDPHINNNSGVDTPEKDWKHLSPYAILYFASRLLVRSFLQFYPFLLIAGIASRDWYILGLIVLGIVAWIAVSIGWAYLSYLNFYYIQKEDRFLIKKGVFSKQKIELPFNRIQDITINQPFYFRPFDLVILKLDSAGSNENEINLAALTRENADAIKQTIQTYSKQENVSQSVEGIEGGSSAQKFADKEESEHLISRSLKDIVIYGITHNRAWLILAFIIPGWGNISDLLEQRFANLTGVDINSWVIDQSFIALGVIVVLLAIALFLLFSTLSILASVFSLYGYKLSFVSRSYSRKSGLLNRYELQVKRSRIQNIRYSQNILERLFNRFTLSMDGFAPETDKSRDGVITGTLFVPSIKHHEFIALSRHILDRFHFPDSQHFKRIDAYYMVRSGIELGIAALLLFSALIYFYDINSSVWLLGIIPVMVGLIVLRWWRYGYWISDEYIILRKGLFGVTYYCFPRFKAQQVAFEQSWFLKRRQLADVEIVLASRVITIPFIDEQVAKDMVNQTIYDSEFASSSWM